MKRNLTDAMCRTKSTDKVQKLSDGGGLVLRISENGSRHWHFRYQRPGSAAPGQAKKENVISFGEFPEVSLVEARAKCDEARALVRQGIDPKSELQRQVVESTAGAATFLGFTSFEAPIGTWWQSKMINEKSGISGTAKTFETQRAVKIQLRTLQDAIGHRPLAEITSQEIIAVLTACANAGNTNKAKRVYQLATRIFDMAVACGFCKYNVAAPCKSVLATHQKQKLPAITDGLRGSSLVKIEGKVGELMRNIRGLTHAKNGRSQLFVGRALEMMALTFPRPANIVTMAWSEIDGDTWIIPAEKMKMRRPHKVPLSRQALAILEQLRPITGDRRYVFSFGEPMNKQCLTRALVSMGHTDQSTHGFRSIASTLLAESGEFSGDCIERAMAHELGGVRGVYNRSELLEERKAMLAWWGDYLDRLAGGNVVPLRVAA